jgi:hypothetical protein
MCEGALGRSTMQVFYGFPECMLQVSARSFHRRTFLWCMRKTFSFFWVEHHVVREKGRIGKDQVVNFLRTDVPSSHYNGSEDSPTHPNSPKSLVAKNTFFKSFLAPSFPLRELSDAVVLVLLNPTF